MIKIWLEYFKPKTFVQIICIKKGYTDGTEGIFGLAARVWASALRLGPP